MIRLFLSGAAVLVAVGFTGGVFAPPGGALPGQCFTHPWGGFCDGPPEVDGSFSHCERSSFGGFSSSNCYQACAHPVTGAPIPTDLDLKTNC